MRRVILALLLLILVAWAIVNRVTSQPTTMGLTEEQKAAIADTVSAANAEFWAALEAADFDRAMSYVHNSAETIWGHVGEMDFGWDAIYAKYGPRFEPIQSQTVTFSDSRATVLNADVVCINELYRAAATDTAGITGSEIDFALLTVWVRRNGAWKILFGHESVPVPALEAESM